MSPDSDSEEAELNIDLIREREPQLNTGDRRHADIVVTHRLWEQVCHEVVDNSEDIDVRSQNQARERVVKWWWSIRDRFKKEFNKEMQAPSGLGGCRSKYKYAMALSIIRSTMVSRSTVCSTREPAVLNPSGPIPQEIATAGHFDRPVPSAPSQPSLTSDPSVQSTSAGASWLTALHEAAGEDIDFPLPHPSDTAATSRTPVGSGRQRQSDQEKSYAPEFLYLNAAFQNCLKLLSEKMTAGFNLLSNNIL
ncbi:C-C chemokine receptor type 6 isoform X2 [Ranitomeya imitator]|uniref:C-C chemokine receptor type 6 isoform X2 n=1 Tax=Ranitomeya imitator TaxID=111125 RepID=UPI0037E7DBEE